MVALSLSRLHYHGEKVSHGREFTAIYKWSDKTVGCSIEEWYPETDVGYYVVDSEFRTVLTHTDTKSGAFAYADGYERGRPDDAPIPLF